MNDLDPLISQALASVKGPTDARPSISDVHRRARRHNRRRMTATVGAVACTGVATAALLIRRDDDSTKLVASGEPAATDDADGTLSPTTTYLLAPGILTTTTMVPMSTSHTIAPSFVWDVLSRIQDDPSAAGLVFPTDAMDVDVMPTADMFGCATDECGAMFNYLVWHEISAALGFFDVAQMQAINAGIDFSNLPRPGDVLQTGYVQAATNPNDVTPTTISMFEGVVLIDGGAPEGAMEDAYQRLAGYNRTIVPAAGKVVDQTVLMPIGPGQPMAAALGDLFGIKDFEPWDPSLVASPVEGMIAIVIGPDYWDLVQTLPPTTATIAATTSIVP